MLQRLVPLILIVCAPAALFAAQPANRSLKQRQLSCQTQYAQAVDSIGLARWSAPEADRPSIERLLNAAAKAKEIIDASFLQWDESLCSADTLGRLHASVERLQSNRWMPSTPAQQRDAEAAAVNAELLKAMDAGFDSPVNSAAAANTMQPVPAAVRRNLSE